MTDRELISALVSRLKSQDIVAEREDYVEIQNGALGEDIVFEFDKNGTLTAIYS